jgi:DNA repair photolyase
MKKDIRDCNFSSITGWRGDSLCCPQAFGGDIFSGCSLNCFFCFCREMEQELFEKYYTGWSRDLVREADPELYKKLFDRAFGSDKETNDWGIKCLRYGLPFNMGSKSETFQFANNNTVIKILELFREYKVPVIFETKSTYVGLQKYIDIIKDLNAAVIISIMGGSDTLNYKLEKYCPPASMRWLFVEELNKKGIWTGVRWEPIMPTINGSDKDLENYAKNAAKYNARHVSLYSYRSSNYYTAKEEFEKRNFNYIKMLEKSTDEEFRPIGNKFFDFLNKYDVPASSPDFVNFPFRSDRLSCCGTDELFKPYLFTFQYALKLIKDKGKVQWEDMENIEFKEPEAYKRMKLNWNGKGQYYNLNDCFGVIPIDKDKNGMNIYAAENGTNQPTTFTRSSFV